MPDTIKAYLVNFVEDPSHTYVYVPKQVYEPKKGGLNPNFYEEIALQYFGRKFLALIDKRDELARFAAVQSSADEKTAVEIDVFPETVRFMIDTARKLANLQARLEKNGARFMELVERDLKNTRETKPLEKIVEKRE